MNAHDLPSSAHSRVPGPLAPSRAAPGMPLGTVARKKGLTFSESLTLGFARVFGLEAFLADWPPQPVAPLSDPPVQFDLEG